MKASVNYVNDGPAVLRYEDLPDPVPAADQVMVQVRSIGIQGGDLLAREHGALPTIPHVVGYQAAGVVAEVGSDVTGFRVGQRVTAVATAGSHAELFCAPAATVWPIPDELSFDEAAAVPVEFGTAHDCLFEFGRLHAGETVLVHSAASGVGIAAVQLARAAGARVIGTASNDQRVAQLGEYGLDLGINYTTTDTVVAVMAATDGRGVDLVVDAVGGPILQQSIAALAYRGRISWVGNAGRGREQPNITPLMPLNASLNGVFFGAELFHSHDRVYALVEGLLDRVTSGELKVVIDSTFTLREAAAAHRRVESRLAFGRVVLHP